jgi:hypothetical protein
MSELIFSFLGPVQLSHPQIGEITITKRKALALPAYLVIEVLFSVDIVCSYGIVDLITLYIGVVSTATASTAKSPATHNHGGCGIHSTA